MSCCMLLKNKHRTSVLSRDEVESVKWRYSPFARIKKKLHLDYVNDKEVLNGWHRSRGYLFEDRK